jgi:arsenical pump membrane protein
MQEAIAYGTLIMTVALVLSLPRTGIVRHIGPAAISALAVLVLLTTGVVSPTDVAGGVQVLWRPFITILSIMLTTNVAHRLGLLDHFARLLEPRSGQSVARVFCSVFILSAGTSAVLNNDAAVLLLTPLIVGLVRRCYPERPDLLVPFAFAVFSAAGVAPLVISNPMNLIVAEYAGIGFNEYAARMIPISIVGWLMAYAILRLIFHRQLKSTEKGVTAISPRLTLSRPAKQFVGLVLIALGCYPALSYGCGPVWAVAAASATLGIGLCWYHNIASPRGLAASLSWEIIIFLFCVFVIVLGLRNVGLVDRVTELYSSATSPASKIMVIGTSSAIGSAILNNHPMAILNALAIYNLPQGTRRIRDDGCPLVDGERWPPRLQDHSDLGLFLRGLFFIDPGRYRVIVFVLPELCSRLTVAEMSQSETINHLLRSSSEPLQCCARTNIRCAQSATPSCTRLRPAIWRKEARVLCRRPGRDAS